MTGIGDVIIFGYMVNIFTFILFSVLFSIIEITRVTRDPKSFLELQNMENNINELKRLKRMAPFQEKYIDIIVMLLPYANVLKAYIVLNGLIREGGFAAFVESEIKRVRKVVEDSIRKENE